MEKQLIIQKLLDMARLLNGEEDIDRFFELIIVHISNLLNTERSSFFLLDTERKELWSKVAEGLKHSEIRLPIGKGIAGRCARTAQPFFVNHPDSDPDFDSSWDKRHGYSTRNVLCYPILGRNGQLKGVLQAINKKDGPFDSNDLELASACAAEIAIALENYELLQAVKQAFKDFASALVKTMEAKHPITAGHSQRVTAYTLFLAEKMGLNFQETELCHYACLLHDIGKIAIPDSILTKPGRFSEQEKKVMEGHAIWTRRILEKVRWPKGLEMLPIVASSHHERMDGSGYPEGLCGEDIPLPSRIMAVTDVFDALTSRRDYPKYDGQHTGTPDPFDLERVFNILQQNKGIHLDAHVVELLYAHRQELEALMRRLHTIPEQD